MIPTVQKGLRLQPIPQEQFPAWTQKELIPFLSQVRQGLNYINRVQATTTTASTATFTAIWSSADIAVGTSVRIEADVLAITSTTRSAFTITGLFYNNGTTAQEGATSAGYTQNTAGYAVQFLVVANHVELQVKDTGAGSVQWTAVIDAQEAP